MSCMYQPTATTFYHWAAGMLPEDVTVEEEASLHSYKEENELQQTLKRQIIFTNSYSHSRTENSIHLFDETQAADMGNLAQAVWPRQLQQSSKNL